MSPFRIAVALVIAMSPTAFAYKAAQFDPVWKGSVEDADLAKDAPSVVVSQKGLAALWEKWKLAGKVPEVDFEKNFVVVATTRGSVLNLHGLYKEDGELSFSANATRDLRPGFRYAIGVLPRGPKTVNGKPLPKE
jgi:hypothetical protein